MVTEGITRGPVSDIIIDPSFENRKILGFILFPQRIGPMTGNKAFFQIARLPKFLTELKNFRFALSPDLFKVVLPDFADNGGFHAVQPDLLLKKRLAGSLRIFIRILLQLLSDLV